MKKRILCALFCLFFAVMLLPVTAFADVILEPHDEFYEKHSQECQHDHRDYSPLGQEDRAVFYNSPEDPQESFSLENGKSIEIRVIYTDDNDISWGYAEIYTNSGYISGWVPMEHMMTAYNPALFLSQYSEEIKYGSRRINENRTFDVVFLWAYPGSESRTSLRFDKDYVLKVKGIFTDEQGREWGLFDRSGWQSDWISERYGRKYDWIFMDNPGAAFEEIYPDGAPVRDKRYLSGNESQIVNSENEKENNGKADEQVNTDPIKRDVIAPDTGADVSALRICFAAVALVVIVTVILLVCLKKRKK